MKKFDNIKHGQWIFSCKMQPLQFDKWEDESDKDGFNTLEGSNHSAYHCGCKPISEKYALWFIENKCWDLFSKDVDPKEQWNIYIDKVKKLCEEHNIEYEGI